MDLVDLLVHLRSLPHVLLVHSSTWLCALNLFFLTLVGDSDFAFLHRLLHGINQGKSIIFKQNNTVCILGQFNDLLHLLHVPFVLIQTRILYVNVRYQTYFILYQPVYIEGGVS